MLARCLQHETDHLDGILFVDRMDAATAQARDEGRARGGVGRGTGTHGPAQPARDLRPGHVVRLVFAGTPEVAVPSLDALAASSHEVVAVVTRPDAPAGRGRSLGPVTGSRSGRRARCARCSPPRRPRTRASTRRCASWRPTPARSSRTAPSCRRAALDIPAARLGQPALLAAARLARCGAGAARGHGRRRRHRGVDLPHRGGPRHRSGVRHDDRDDPAHRHGGRPARPARGRRRRAARRPRWTASRTAPWSRNPSRRKVFRSRRRSRSTTPGSTGPGPRSSSTVRFGAARRTPARGRRSAASGSRSSPVTPAADDPTDGPAGTLVVTKRAVHVAHGRPGSVRLGVVQGHGKKPMPAADWARGLRIEPGERFGDA